MKRCISLIGIILLVWANATVAHGERRRFALQDIHRLKWPTDGHLSPDGRWVAFSMSLTDVEHNRRNSDIYIVSTQGGEVRRMTTHEASDIHPRWTPDGRRIAFLSTRSGSAQIWTIRLDGGEAEQLSDLPVSISDFEWTPDGQHVVFVADVYPDCPTLECTRQRDERKEKKQVKAMIHRDLLYRHWDRYEDGKVQHLFTLTADGKVWKDVTPRLKLDALQWWLAAAGRDWDISPDSRMLAFATNLNGHLELNYDVDIYLVPLAGGEIENLTEANPAADSLPRFSPDGRQIAYRASKRVGYESDEYELIVMDLQTRRRRSLTDAFPHSVGEIFWAPDGRGLYFSAGEAGRMKLFYVPLDGGPVREVLGGPYWHHAIDVSSHGLVFSRRDIAHADEIFMADLGGRHVRQLTSVNADFYDEVITVDAEEFYYTGARGRRIHGFLVKPLDFDPNKKYPLLVRIHGGPQQMFGFSFRYEYQLFAAAGYVVLFVNPAGSPGYGQAFTDAVNHNWGGDPYIDIMRGVDEVIKRGFVDERRMAAWGGSYGGYMVNWIEGHTDRFACLVSHAGVANMWSMYGSTEELFFPEWEMGGPPWERPEEYDRWSPIRYAKNFRTPMLISHGERDYRVPITEGEQMFTALRRQGIEARFLRFPDEGHWILKPKNRDLWYGTILEWVNAHCRPAPSTETEGHSLHRSPEASGRGADAL